MRALSRFSAHRKGVAAILIGLVAALVLSGPALAGMGWCRSDPVVRLNGTDVQILVAIPEQYQSLVNGPVEVTVRVPSSVSREIVMTDAGFNGYGETVRFEDQFFGSVDPSGAFDTRVRVRVPMDLSGLPFGTMIPVQVELIPTNGPAQTFSGVHLLTRFVTTIQGSR